MSWLTVFLGMVILGLVGDDLYLRSKFKESSAALEELSDYAQFSMDEMWSSVQMEAITLKVPERELPKEVPQRLLALTRRVRARVDRCEVALARLQLESRGYKVVHEPPEY